MDMVSNSNLRSQTLDLLRFPLAIVVLAVHVFSISRGITLQGTVIETRQSLELMEMATFVNAFFRGQSVPIYFFISGFVFFLGLSSTFTKDKYIQKLKNRTKTLLIPYLIWNAMAILLIIVRMLPCFKEYLSYTDTELNLTFSNLLSCFWMYNGQLSSIPAGTDMAIHVSSSTFPINTPLWFLRDLMIVVLLTPILYKVIKNIGYYWVAGLGVFWFIGSVWYAGYWIKLLTAFFFFSWGAYMSISQKDMLAEFGKFFKSSMILYPLLGVLYIVAQHLYPHSMGVIKQLNVVIGLFFAYNLASWLLKRGFCKVNSLLASASFFIYVSHMLVCDRIIKILYLMIKPANSWSIVVVYLTSIIVSTTILLAVFYLMKRYTPSLLKVMSGRK